MIAPIGDRAVGDAQVGHGRDRDGGLALLERPGRRGAAREAARHDGEHPPAHGELTKHFVQALQVRREVGVLRPRLLVVEPDGLAVAPRVVAADLVERGELVLELGDERRGLLGALGLDVDRALDVLERGIDAERIVAGLDEALAPGRGARVAAALPQRAEVDADVDHREVRRRVGRVRVEEVVEAGAHADVERAGRGAAGLRASSISASALR